MSERGERENGEREVEKGEREGLRERRERGRERRGNSFIIFNKQNNLILCCYCECCVIRSDGSGEVICDRKQVIVTALIEWVNGVSVFSDICNVMLHIEPVLPFILHKT